MVGVGWCEWRASGYEEGLGTEKGNLRGNVGAGGAVAYYEYFLQVCEKAEICVRKAERSFTLSLKSSGLLKNFECEMQPGFCLSHPRIPVISGMKGTV